MNLREYIIEERKYLHDVSNHVVVLEGMLASGLKKLEATPEVSNDLDKLRKSLASAIKIREATVLRKKYVETVQDSIID
jgi:hypothetical protein